MKIGIYGGTFDPLHTGHLILARDAVETLGLDRLVFVPNLCSPHKETRPPAPAESRLEMLRAAIEGEPCFAVDEMELHRPPPSYAVETVRELHRRHPGSDFFYLIGEDNLAELHTWREIESLKKLAQFVVLSRSGSGEKAPIPYPVLERRVEISSTEIRTRVAKGLSIRYLVPGKVLEIIQRQQLYKE